MNQKQLNYCVTNMELDKHEPGCMANMQCLVIHSDGICPGPYGKCTCKLNSMPLNNNQSWEQDLDKLLVKFEKEGMLVYRFYPNVREHLKSHISQLLEQVREEIMENKKGMQDRNNALESAAQLIEEDK